MPITLTGFWDGSPATSISKLKIQTHCVICYCSAVCCSCCL